MFKLNNTGSRTVTLILTLTSLILVPNEKKKLPEISTFTLLFGASRGFMKAEMPS